MNPSTGRAGAARAREVDRDGAGRRGAARGGRPTFDPARLHVVGETGSLAAGWSVHAPASLSYRWAGAESGLRAAARALDAAAKRALDIVFAALGLLLTAPAWIVIPYFIRRLDGGPVFYGQERAGRDGKRFRSWKFRSMRPLTEAEAAGGPCLRAELEQHRVTRLGRVLRRMALDEIPQLWNILKGDMSLVGPRALLPEEVVEAGARGAAGGRSGGGARGGAVRLEDLPGYEERQSVRPGLTGLAQVHASRDISHRQKFRFDLLYVRRRTLWLDISLIFRSVFISIAGRWPEVGKGRS